MIFSMPSFSCDYCQVTLKKKAAENHLNSCSSVVSCLDCGKSFDYDALKAHTQCISEAQKYQGKLFRPKGKDKNQEKKPDSSVVKDPKGSVVPVESGKTEAGATKSEASPEKQKKQKKRDKQTAAPLIAATAEAANEKQSKKKRKRESKLNESGKQPKDDVSAHTSQTNGISKGEIPPAKTKKSKSENKAAKDDVVSSLQPQVEGIVKALLAESPLSCKQLRKKVSKSLKAQQVVDKAKVRSAISEALFSANLESITTISIKSS